MDIVRDHKIDVRFLSRLLTRCLAAHTDGRIQGFRGLIPHARAKTYRRIKRADRLTSPHGLTGAVGQLFECLPQLPRIIERQIGSGRLGLTQTNRVYRLTVTHSKLIAACHEAGLTEADYPLHQDEKGYRSFARWVKRRLEDRIPLRLPHDNGAWQMAARPFSVIELDGHKLDLRLRVRFTEPSGISVSAWIWHRLVSFMRPHKSYLLHPALARSAELAAWRSTQQYRHNIAAKPPQNLAIEGIGLPAKWDDFTSIIRQRLDK
ncbi:hypothetical protein IQ288_31505 [Burkholderia sp. R-69980]|nr:hypothetical protein [Burkholderia sp. R-69980]